MLRVVAFLLGATSITVSACAQEAALPNAPTFSHSRIHAPGEIDEEQGPFIIDATYTFDIWRAARGGVRNGTRYLDNLDVVARADMERLVGWNGGLIYVYGLYNNGKSLTNLIGDAQATSNIETGIKAVRLYEAWINQEIGANASVKVGLYDLNSEFDALDVSGVFVGSSHGIGKDISQTGQNGPSIFPVTSLAARIAVSPAKGWTLRAAVLDGMPGDPVRPKRTTIKLGNGDGALLIGEIEAALPQGKLLFGHWRYTARFDDFAGGTARGNDGWYLRGEHRLTHEADSSDQGLNGFFRLGVADGKFNTFGSFASAGLNYTGPIKGRDSDQLGLAVAAALTSDQYRLTKPADKSEAAFELTYRAALTDWLTVQPNVQYVINPGANTALGNALAFGLRTELTMRLPR